MRVPLLPTGQSHQLDDLGSTPALGGLVYALYLQAIYHVLENSFVGKVAEVLEHHAHLVSADVTQLLLVHRKHVLAVYVYLPPRRFDKTAETANERRLAASGEAHDDERLSFEHIE